MATEQCLGGGIDSNLVSSPMPAIGLYIVASTLVCLSLLVCDVFLGYRNRKHHLPCSFFSLNSLTLTLLGIATKLPVDINSLMPSPVDQLCKLSGSVLVTVCMGFFISSVCDMSGFELFGNVASLTILVVTIFVNISIQLKTGLIFSFYFVEHVIALVLMLQMLCAVWYVSLIKDWTMGATNDHLSYTKEKIAQLRPFFQRIKNLFLISRVYCPQMPVTMYIGYATYVGLLSILSFLLVLEAVLRTFCFGDKGFCRRESDYKWSTWVVFVAQFLTVGIGSSAITLRALFFETNYNPSDRQKNASEVPEDGFKGQYTPLLLMADAEKFLSLPDFMVLVETVSSMGIYSLQGICSINCIQISIQVLQQLLIYLLFATYRVLISTDYMVKALCWYTKKSFPNTFTKSSLACSLELLSIKYVEKVSRKCSTDVPYYLIQLLSDTQPSLEVLNAEGNCLLSVFLVQISSVLSPTDFSKSLVSAFDEVFELVFFLEENLVSRHLFYSGLYRKLAKDLWMCRNLSSHWFQKKIISPLKRKYPHIDENSSGFSSRSHLDRSTNILKDFMSSLSRYPILDTKEDLDSTKPGTVSHFQLLENLKGNTPEEIDAGIKQLFVDIMHCLLPQLPRVVSEYTSQSVGVELDERAEVVFKLVSKYEMLRRVVAINWLPPETDDDQLIQPNDNHADIENQLIQPDDDLAETEGQRPQPDGNLADIDDQLIQPVNLSDTEEQRLQPDENFSDIEEQRLQPDDNLADVDDQLIQPDDELADTEEQRLQPDQNFSDIEEQRLEPDDSRVDTDYRSSMDATISQSC